MTASFKINEIEYSVDLSTLPPDITLNTFIREHAQLTATKFMCLEGGCGACVVAVKGKHPTTGEIRIWAANSCLILLNTCAEWEIITCEGIGNKRDGYHPIQRRMAKMNGTQCGFCTPGFIMNMYSLLESKNGRVSMEEVENSFGGNICRCTGYRPILDAMKSLASDSNIKIPDECQDIEDLPAKICPKNGKTCFDICRKPLSVLSYDDGSEWFWPTLLNDLFQILQKINASDEEYMLVAGNTAHGVYRRSKTIQYYIDINAIGDLKKHVLTADKLLLGANLSLAETMDIFLNAAKQPGFEYCQQLWKHFDLIANVPVRNMGTLAGNISIKKTHREFPSDVFLTLEALDAQVVFATSTANEKSMPILAYMQDKTHNAVILAFELKAYPKEKYIFKSYKIMPRAQNAHAIVNAAFLLDVDTYTGKVKNSRLCFGGINPEFVHASKVEDIMKDQCFYAKAVVEKIFLELPRELEPNALLPDPSPEYRRQLACGLMLKFLLECAPADKVKPEYKSGGPVLKRALSSGIQTFDTQQKFYPITQPIGKVDALIQCSGEATYMNDTLTSENSVYCAFVTATKVGSVIEQIDASEALKIPGVIAFYSAKDIPGTNSFVATDFRYEVEELFAADLVRYYDQPLGIIVAASSDIANYATSKVKVIYSTQACVIMTTMQDVFENDGTQRVHSQVKSPLKDIKLSDNADITCKGIFEIGSQYHFTMEPQTCVAVPFEQGLQIWSSTQWMDHTQAVISKMLQIRAADVQLKIRRLGGAYGSKVTRGNAVACAASLAAYKLNRPARFVQTIESMMTCNGKRWACRSDYEFHVKANGKIVGLSNTFYTDAGCSLNENPLPIYVVPAAKNCYAFTDDNLKLEINAVITDATSSTWCRAPGSLEGIAMIENVMEHIAFEANIDPADARLANITPGHKMNELLSRFIESTEYKKRRLEIDSFNLQNRWLKRGIGLALMEFALEYIGQYSATVAIYHADGSVVISHGGIEMGQGINTKITQVAAHDLGIPLELIKVEASDTLNGANSFVTAASVGSESVCYAVRKACKTLNERLQSVKDSLKKDAIWFDIVKAAWSKSINMIASEHYKVGDLEHYSIYGLALTEVKVDILTGNNLVTRVDILEDAGESLSPFIDIGQIEGAFIMGLGYWLTEDLVYNRQNGQLITNRTWNYKTPGAKDIPIDFRIEMLQGFPNPAGFMRSKATGEPPCCLAVSVIFAVQHAIQSARNDAGLKKEWVRLGAPTTPETLVLNAGSAVTSYALE